MRAISRILGFGFFVVVLTATPVFAGKPTTKTTGSQASVKAAKPPSAVKASPKPSKPVKTPTTSTTASAKTTKANAKARHITAKADVKAAKTTKPGAVTTATPASTTTSGTATAGTTNASVWQPTNGVSKKLSTKPNLLSKVQSSLPAGTDLNAATAGFKNFGQFVAAVNVSNNLGINFADLKTAMTGVSMTGIATTQPTMSLGQAIQRFRPDANTAVEVRTAETLASQEIIAPVNKARKSGSTTAS